jgi:thiol-disulfide isomerase/thioredoxin
VVSWLDEFTDSSRRPEVEGMLLYLVSEDESEAATKHLELLAKSKDKDIAGEAKSLLDSRKFLSTLRTTPLELTFTDLEGAKVDCSKLRGSVVLLDFWASESQQCLDAMQSLVKLHKAHGDKTLKIIGINLDKDKSDAKFAAAQHGLSWPHHHDGEQENGFAAKFQIESIPSVWLFDKKGKLREVGLEGEELTEAVEKLLKEQVSGRL